MTDILDRIDAATAGLCPCGGQPREGSAYCGEECEPTHIAEDTDAPGSGTPTAMRWRPDLVTAADDTDLIPLGSQTNGYTGPYTAQVYGRASDPTVWHLRLDDGHRFVGVDLTDVGGPQDPISTELVGRVREAWQRLERDLNNPAHAWAGWTDLGYVDETAGTRGDVVSALLSRAEAVVFVRSSADGSIAELEAYRPAAPRARCLHHNLPAQAVDVSAGSLAAVALAARESFRPVAEAAEQFLRQWGVQLTAWQRAMVGQMVATQVIHPRRFGRSAAALRSMMPPGFRPLVNARDAAVLAEHGLQEGVDFTRYPTMPGWDEPPPTSMLQAIEAKKRRNTGPGPDRLDGRRRRRR